MLHPISDSAAAHALENGAFVPFFQPQYNFETGAMIGAEVLVRWIMDDGEIVAPGEFVPEFEKSGFIYDMDKAIWSSSRGSSSRTVWDLESISDRQWPQKRTAVAIFR